MARLKATLNGVVPFTPEEEAEVDAIEAAWAAGETDRKAAALREERNKLLAETDWRFRSDLTPSQEWINYCQALRDITDQATFPNEVTWPIKPE